MKITVESMGQFCGARAADLIPICEVMSVVSGLRSNSGVALRAGLLEALEGVIRELQQASKDCDAAMGYTDDEGAPPPKSRAADPGVPSKRGRKPKAAKVVPVEKPTVPMFPPDRMEDVSDGPPLSDSHEVEA